MIERVWIEIDIGKPEHKNLYSNHPDVLEKHIMVSAFLERLEC